VYWEALVAVVPVALVAVVLVAPVAVDQILLVRILPSINSKCHFHVSMVTNPEFGRTNVWIISVYSMFIHLCGWYPALFTWTAMLRYGSGHIAFAMISLRGLH
jgi:hypothetical protein